MSFNHNSSFSSDLEAQRGSSKQSQYKDFPEFEKLSQSINNNLYDVNNHQLTSIRNLLQKYEQLQKAGSSGEQADGNLQTIPRKLSELMNKSTESFKTINKDTKALNDYLGRCESNHEDPDTLRYLRQKEGIFIKLIRTSIGQFHAHQKKFESLQQGAIDKLNHDTAVDSKPSGLESEEGNTSTSQQHVQIEYQAVNAEELEQQTLLIQEREQEIQQITNDISEINDIFTNLHQIVSEQQFTIDSIEDNILRYDADARGASRELASAERYQRRSGGRMFCCFLILVGVLGSVVLIGVIF